jgi:hypothetical protein
MGRRKPTGAAPSSSGALEVEHLRFGRKVDQMWAAVEQHIGKKLGLVNLTSLGTGDSNPNGDFLFNEIGQVVVGTVTGDRLLSEVPGLVCPGHSTVDEEQIHLVALGVSDLCKLKTSCRCIVVVFAQDEQKISHLFLLFFVGNPSPDSRFSSTISGGKNSIQVKTKPIGTGCF